MTTYPRSPFDTLGGLLYFPRMLDKIRLDLRKELPGAYLELLGKGFDARICKYLGLEYEAVVDRARGGASDEEILEWAQATGMTLNPERIEVWNGFATKRGWNDSGTPTLQGFKQESGLSDREDIRTFFEFIEIDEKRAS